MNPFRSARGRRTAGLILLAVAARTLYWLSTLRYTPISDASSYQSIASNLARGRGFSDFFPQLSLHPTAFRPPGFPLLLGGIYRVLGVSVGLGRLTNLVIGVAVVLLVERFVSRIGGPTAGLVAAVAVALYPPLVVNDVTILTESLSLLLLVLLFLALSSERWWLAAIETGVLVLTRHSAQLLAVLVAVLLARWMGWKRALAYVGIVLVVVAPWVVRNDLQLGSPVLNTANGFNLAAMYSSEAFDSGGFVDPVFDLRFSDLRLLQFDEVEWDRALRDRGLAGIRSHPSSIARVGGSNLIAFFELRPGVNDHPEGLDGRNLAVRHAALPIFYAVTLAGLYGLWRGRRHRMVVLVGLTTAYFSLTSIFSVSPPRLRAPFDLAACMGVGLLVGDLHARRRTRATP